MWRMRCSCPPFWGCISGKGGRQFEEWYMQQEVCQHDSAQVGVLPIDWRRWSQAYPAFSRTPLLSDLLSDERTTSSRRERPNAQAGLIRSALIDTEPDQRLRLLEQYCSKE